MDDLRDVRYLGDGVYAGHDGYQIWIYTDREVGRHCIALEPAVLAALVGYNRDLKKFDPEAGACELQFMPDGGIVYDGA